MKRIIQIIVVAMAVAAMAIPAVAQFTEPTRPIEGFVAGQEIRVYPYQQGPSAKIPCDGTGVVDFSAIRIETIIDTGRAGLGPTEHWRVDLDYLGVDQSTDPKQRLVIAWGGKWDHQNSPGRTGQMEIYQFSHNATANQNGPARIDVVVTGQESRDVFKFSCPFTIDVE